MNIEKELEDLIEECEIGFFEDSIGTYTTGVEISHVRRILKQAYNLGLETAAQNATATEEQQIIYGDTVYVSIVNKHSILKLKI